MNTNKENNRRINISVLSKEQLGFFEDVNFAEYEYDYVYKYTKKLGKAAYITDFAYITGVENMDNRSKVYPRFYGKGRIGKYWLADTKIKDQETYKSFYISIDNEFYVTFVENNQIGIRPIINYSSISLLLKNIQIINHSYKCGEFGEYPQSLCSKKLELKLEFLYALGFLKETGKNYTINAINSSAEKKFSPFVLREYEYKGEKYVRCAEEMKVKACWIKVEPIVWIISEKNDICLAEKILLGGIQFNDRDHLANDFSQSNLKWYLDNFFSKDIIPIEDMQTQFDTEENNSEIGTDIKEDDNFDLRCPINEQYQTVVALLEKLKIINFNKYLQFKEELKLIVETSFNEDNQVKNDGEIVLYLYDSLKANTLKNLINLEAKIKLILDFKLYGEVDIITSIDNFINEFINDVEAELNKIKKLREIDKMSKLFLNNIENISLKNQIEIFSKISVLYLFIIKTFNISKVELEKNSCIIYFKKYLYLIIKKLLESGKVIIDDLSLLNISEDINLCDILKIINNIEFVNKDEKRLKLSKWYMEVLKH